MSMNLQIYNLSPDQYKRANILTAQMINIIYAIFILLVWITKTLPQKEKIIYTVILVLWYLVIAVGVTKNISFKKGMLILAAAFEMSYLLIAFISK